MPAFEMESGIGIRDGITMALLDVFSRDGSREPEISVVLTIADTADRGFHEQLKPKEDRVSAFLEDRRAIWMRWFENEIEARYEVTGGGLEIIADVLQEGFEDPKGFGFAFINVVSEGRDLHDELIAIGRAQKEHLRRFIEQLALKMGLQHPDLAASAAVLVIERTIVHTLITGSLKEVHAARLLFQCLQHA